jgi:hypothetical protein
LVKRGLKIMRRFPGTFPIYKKNGAAQFTIISPKIDDNGRISKNGAILLEVASSSGERSYDWKNKISFAIGMNDLSLWFNNPDSPNKLIHKTPNSPLMKTLEVLPGEGKYAGTYQLKLSEKNNNDDSFRSVFVPVTGGEYTVLLRLLMHAAPLLIGWDNESPQSR